jgi:hypothetical protein
MTSLTSSRSERGISHGNGSSPGEQVPRSARDEVAPVSLHFSVASVALL